MNLLEQISIGSIVKWMPGEVITKITAIKIDENQFTLDTEVYCESNNRLEPVVITEEFLLKNGFEYDINGFLCINGFRLRKNSIHHDYFSTEHFIRLEYVHQLQNLLKVLKINHQFYNL